MTEATYFLLAPWYIAMLFVHRDAVFGGNWKTRLLTSVLGGAAIGGLLYFADCLLRAAVFGSLKVAWSPARLDLVVLGCASAVVETVIVQLGLQARIGGLAGISVAVLAFFAMHLSLNPIFLLAGVAFAVVQWYTDLPGPVIIAHLVYNGLMSSFPPV